MGRYLLVALLFIVIFVTGYFGQHFGYTVHGVPMGSPAAQTSSEDWRESSYGLDVVLSYWQEHFKTNAFVQSIAYIYAFCTFSIDGTPDWMVGVFYLIILLSLVLLWSMVRGE